MTVICRKCCEKRSCSDCIHYEGNDTFVCYFCLTHYISTSSDECKKQPKKLKNCDVFTIVLGKNINNYYPFVEWGIAKEQGKILMLLCDDKYRKLYGKTYKYLMKESIQSIEHLSDKLQNKILKNCMKLVNFYI